MPPFAARARFKTVIPIFAPSATTAARPTPQVEATASYNLSVLA
jgi:hypothetical protein